jgi:SOS-response transcriptional repressor LexA
MSKNILSFKPPITPDPELPDTDFRASICGTALIYDGILEGDEVYIRREYRTSELTPGRIVAARTPYGLLVKHYWPGLNGTIRLLSSNPEYDDLVFESGEITILGIAERAERKEIAL